MIKRTESRHWVLTEEKTDEAAAKLENSPRKLL
jgi:hypothetical protein